MFRVQADVTVAEDFLRNLSQPGRELARVVGRTLNRTMAHGKSMTSRFLRNRINLKKAVIDQAITTRRSREVQNMSAITIRQAWFEITWTGSPIALRDYAAREIKRGVTFKVARQGPRKLYMRNGQKAFVIEKLGGHVFVRVGPDPKGPKKAPIKKVYGPSIPQFAVTGREQRLIIEAVRKFWAAELVRNYNFAIAKRNAQRSY